MSKPEPRETRIAEHWPYVREMADRMSQAKRLTDAELAAEYWQAFSGVWDGHGNKARLRREVIERFATLPHHDEVRA